MKRTIMLFGLALAVWVCACLITTADAAENEEDLYYGDYAYILTDGQATIVASSGGQCGPSWDDEEDGFNRPGTEDESARFPQDIDDDGVWRIVIPDKLDGYPVVAIGDYGLAEGVWGDVILPEGLASIDSGAFYRCTWAYAITIPDSVTFIHEYAFDDCFATLRVTEGSYAARYAEENGIPYTYDMDYTVFQSGDWLYTLTGGVATIYGYANDSGYDDDNAVATDLVFPDHLDGYPVAPVEHLPLRLFDAYDLGSVTIPASVTEITGHPFVITENPSDVCHFARFIVSPDNPVYEAIDGVLFDKQKKILISYAGDGTGDYTIPEGVLGISDNAFKGCGSLTGVIIPDSVTYIGDSAFEYNNLTSVIIPEGVTRIGDSAFSSCSGLTSVTIQASAVSIGDSAFSGCRGLTSVTIPKGVMSIGNNAFNRCDGLTSVTILEGVAHIGSFAFNWCSGLTNVTIPASVTSIGANPFNACSLKYIEVSSNNPAYETIDGVLVGKQPKILISYPRARIGAYVIPEGMTSIGDNAFNRCDGLTGVTIPEGVTSIGDHAFIWCEDLTSVTIPASVESIGDWAFDSCTHLTSVTISEGVVHIGKYAFHLPEYALPRYNRIANVTIPASVVSIGQEAFDRYGKPVALSVTEGSYAEQYAQENGIPHVHSTE